MNILTIGFINVVTMAGFIIGLWIARGHFQRIPVRVRVRKER